MWCRLGIFIYLNYYFYIDKLTLPHPFFYYYYFMSFPTTKTGLRKRKFDCFALVVLSPGRLPPVVDTETVWWGGGGAAGWEVWEARLWWEEDEDGHCAYLCDYMTSWGFFMIAPVVMTFLQNRITFVWRHRYLLNVNQQNFLPILSSAKATMPTKMRKIPSCRSVATLTLCLRFRPASALLIRAHVCPPTARAWSMSRGWAGGTCLYISAARQPRLGYLLIICFFERYTLCRRDWIMYG
jgi:hypothetical protein